MKILTAVALFALVFGAGVMAAAPASASGAQTVYSWGQFGEAGPAGPIQPTPTAIAGVPADITQVVATNAATYMLTGSGQVWAFGAGDFGELGNGTTTSSFSTPVRVQFPAGVSIAQLPTPFPGDTMAAIDTSGDIWGWGANTDGSLCLGSATEENVPVQLPFADVTAAAGGGGHASYFAAGTLWSCGQNQYGQLGIGNTKTVMTPRRVHIEAPVTQLYSGYGYTGALLANGTYWNWGINARGQLGDGNTRNADVPVQVTVLGVSGVVSVSVGANTKDDGQTFAVLANGNVKAWGANQYGQLCLGTKSPGVMTPTTVAAQFVSAVAGGRTSYPLDAAGNLWACGDNRFGELGNGTTGAPHVTPVEILSGVTMISSTSRNVVAVTR